MSATTATTRTSSPYDSFILGRLGSDSTAVCGPIPGVGTGSVSVVSNDGTLTSSHTSDSYSVTISSPKNALRFALNGEDNGTLDADLYVRQGAPATTTLFDCKATHRVTSARARSSCRPSPRGTCS
jgi:hypothetical protein